MKKLIVAISLTIAFTNIFSQTLFTYGNNSVTKDEFLRAYNKNKTAVTDKGGSLREYLELYIKFKLKVKAAQDMRLDTLSSLRSELQDFRAQIEEGYLNDETQLNMLVQEAFERSQKDIHVVYWMIPVNNADTSVAFNSANHLYKYFSGLLKDTSGITVSHLQDADLGFITVFTLPYPLENIIYNLKPGQFSKPYYTNNAYYIFKNVEERKAAGKVKAAQILLAIPQDAREEDKKYISILADSIYHAIKAGADFGELAKKYSNDKLTYISGGLLPEFGVGKYEPAFEDKVFALQNPGDLTLPFTTSYGYHIVKLLSKTPVPNTKNDAAYLYTLKQQVQQDTRIADAKEKFVLSLLQKLSYKKNASVKETDLWRIPDSSLAGKNFAVPALTEKTVLFSMGSTNKNLADWMQFAKDYKTSGLFKGETNNKVFKQFIASVALEEYRKKLQDFNADFKYQLKEFKEGNMLFEVMEKKVWSKASNDDAELKKFYEQHKYRYIWSASADAIIISSSNEKIAKEFAEKIDSGKNWRQVAEEYASQVQADSGRYEISQLPVKSNASLVTGANEPVVNESDGTATLVNIIKLYPAGVLRTFDQAKGLIINDYQNFIEERWIEELKKKYPVKINEKVLQSLR